MHRLICNLLSIASMSVAGLAGAAYAEIPNKSPDQLEELASHIFTGKVMKIYSTVDRSSPKWEFTYSVAEIQVADVEKGEHEGRLAYVRFWRKRFMGDGPPEPSHYGHRGVPKVGSHTRVYVMTEEEDGGYDVLSPNGFAADPAQRN
ncbi:MAG TPA: hypothetical protein VJ828_05455 [Lacipirellulaceae bacterium]|nr:hypothetical protein [Lacipirellulaceae bacterium]